MLFHYHNDGDLDVFTANGTAEELKLQLPLLLENDGNGNFKNVGPKVSPYFQEKRSGRGAAVVDFDNDGWLDIIVSHIDLKATPALLRNIGDGSYWLGVSLIGKDGPSSAVSALVTVVTKSKTQVLVNQPANTYLSWNDPRVHVGLGQDDVVESIEIAWSHGNVETYRNIRANQYITIRQGHGIQ